VDNHTLVPQFFIGFEVFTDIFHGQQKIMGKMIAFDSGLKDNHLLSVQDFLCS